MKKITKVLGVLIICGVIAVAFCGMALADPVILTGGAADDENAGGPGQAENDASSWATATVLSGTVLQVNDEYILMNSVNDSGTGPTGMVSLRVDPDLTLIVDAADGYPLSLTEIQEGETIYAYVGAAMTLSLPPQISASMVICQIPEDGSVPLFTKVVSLTDNGDDSYRLAVAGGDTYTVPAGCQIRPFLTRNIVTLSDLNPGSNCLIWYDDQKTVSKIVIVQQ